MIYARCRQCAVSAGLTHVRICRSKRTQDTSLMRHICILHACVAHVVAQETVDMTSAKCITCRMRMSQADSRWLQHDLISRIDSDKSNHGNGAVRMYSEN